MSFVPTLSVEEEAIMADEHSEAEIAMDNGINEAERIQDIADVANDATLVVSDIPEVGQVEQDLVASVADMAVAGTDASATDVLSVTNADGAVSTEGIASALKSLWDTIVSALKNMWAGIRNWLTTYFATLDRNKRHAEKLIQRLDGMRGWTASDDAKVEISDMFGYARQSLGAKQLFGRIGVVMVEHRTMVATALETQKNVMLPLGDELIRGYKEFGQNKDMAVMTKVVQAISTQMEGYIKSLGISEDGKVRKNNASKEVAQMTIHANGYNKHITDPANSTETKIALLAKVRFSVDQDTNLIGNGRKVTMRVDMTPDMLKADVQKDLDIINGLIKYRDNEFKQLEAKSELVQRACEAMLGTVKDGDKGTVALAKKLMPMTTAYANWATQPGIKLLSTVARHLQYWLTLSEKCANMFHEQTVA